MGDFNIDLQSCSNSKWLNLIQLFDLTQFVKEPTRVTESSSTIIDHAYSSDSANITECFVPSYAISDHFPICFTRKVNSKISKTVHTMSSYRYEGVSKSFEPNMERARNLDLFCFIFQRSPLPTPHTCPI